MNIYQIVTVIHFSKIWGTSVPINKYLIDTVNEITDELTVDEITSLLLEKAEEARQKSLEVDPNISSDVDEYMYWVTQMTWLRVAAGKIREELMLE